jgi:hypothetical protein
MSVALMLAPEREVYRESEDSVVLDPEEDFANAADFDIGFLRHDLSSFG